MDKTSHGIPRGIEVLVKKASIDAVFRSILLEKRAGAAAEIGLDLTPEEEAMLASVPASQLEATIARTQVPDEHRRAFLGKAAAAMLATLGAVAIAGCPTKGSKPDRPPAGTGSQPDDPKPKEAPQPPPPTGISPDRPGGAK